MTVSSVSIIVTCYNYERYVGAAIESALAQTYSNVEVVVVNDGSSDRSRDVIERYASRVRIVDQPNSGSIAAYNAGFAAASGAIVILLDADDLLEPNAVAKVVEAWRENTVKVQWDLKIIDAESRDLGRRFCHFDATYDQAKVRETFARTGTYRWPVSVGNAYARWFMALLFPLDRAHGPDGVLNTVAPLYGDVVTIPEALASYRVHGQNLWSSSGADLTRFPERIAHRLQELELLQEHAARRNVSLPSVFPLDHELAFLGYRLMSRKLGLPYPAADRDSTPRLVCAALKLLWSEHYPARHFAAHALWFIVVGSVPRSLASELIRLRFQRGRWQGRWADLRQRWSLRGSPA